MSLSPVHSLTPWYGLNFRSPRIASLPRPVRLGPHTYLLDYARVEDEAWCWEMIASSRERGDNISVSQYTSEDDVRFHLRFSVPFTLTRSGHGQGQGQGEGEDPEALIIIHPSVYSRTVDTCQAHGRIHRSEALSRDQQVYDDMVGLAVTLAEELNLGYTHVVFNVASSLRALVESHRRLGFLVAVTVPSGVKLNHLGTSDDLIMIRRLTHTQRPRRSDDDIMALCTQHALDGSHVIEGLREGGMLPLPFLPLPYVYENGFKVTVRPLQFSESEMAYHVWKTAAGKGEGYGLDECPTLEMFQLIMMLDHFCVVFEDAQTRHLVGLTFITDTWYTRNPDVRYGETSVFLTEQYRGRGLGPETTHIGLLLLKQLGYTATLNDALLSNARMFRTLKSSPVPPLALGVIPDSTYTAGRGWDDQVVLLADYSLTGAVETFVRAAEKSLERERRPESKL